MNLPIQDSRLDWVTATAKHDKRGVDLLHFATAQTYAERGLGNKLERWRFHGYEGFQSGRWRYGWGEHGAVAVASGEQAQLAAPHLAQLADHWSRVDYAVTVLDQDDAIRPDEDYWDAWPWKDTPLKTPASVTRIQELARGATFSIGERSSAYYLRVYNKHHESRGDYPRGSWRWELELKQHASEAHHARWKAGGYSQGDVLTLLATEMRRYSLPVPWRSEGTIKRAPQPHHAHDADRILGWLNRQVTPAVQFAIEARGYEAVARVLGLPTINYAEPPTVE